MKELVVNLIPAIEDAQEEARNGIAACAQGAPPLWWWTIVWLPADKLAYITSRVLLGLIKKNRAGIVRPVTNLAITVGGNIKLELELEQWKQQEAKLAGQNPQHTNMFALLSSYVDGPLTKSTFYRWKRKLKSIETENWSTTMKAHVGAKLISLAVEHGGGWFGLETVHVRGKTIKHIILSPAATAALMDITASLEVRSALYLPMISPPRPWRRKETE